MIGLALLFAHGVSTLLMVGIIWFVQVVHYPLMASVGPAQFCNYSRLNQSRTTVVIALPMLIEAITAICLLFWTPALRTSPIFWTANGLLLLIWVSTALWQVPLHESFLIEFNPQQIRRLVRS